ncbi:phosphoglycerate mutase-like protein 1 [Hibiscus syriacus]|uniref:phosphoglycerate mutase-like protein 1 n=1 Tax=Hibiscus syriacus TaxID=106335 RepID=UPI0019225611|nr:phosphoglycerate mutase-like protein 1 [Hibiscus syriacus]
METISSAPYSYQQYVPHKLVHLVRHAQGLHNLEPDRNRDPLTSFEFIDAQLTSQGWKQVRCKRKDVCAIGLLNGIEVVITSPMSKKLQTAVGIFHGEDGIIDETPASNRPPIIAFEQCRERLGKYECDKRRSISQYRSRFSAVDFSLIENEADNLWKANEREALEDVLGRGMKFFNWLWTRKEKEIAVLSHGVFLQQAMIGLINTNKCLPLMEDDPRSRFKNCEIRSVIIFYESVTGLGSSSVATN